MLQTVMTILTSTLFTVIVTDLYKSGKPNTAKAMDEDKNELNMKMRRTM